jgi:hypothetical protein
LFGITSILGSGGFNLVGNAIKDGGAYFPITLLLSGALFTGSASSYSYAHDTFKKNTSETLLIESAFGSIGKNISIFSILFYNIFATATILILCSKLLFPNGTYIGQVSFALILLSMMCLSAFQRLDINKEIINAFSIGIIGLLSFATYLGIGGLAHSDAPIFPSKINLYESFLYFFFVLAGHDALIKFSEETVNPEDIDKSMYISIFASIVLIGGLCLAAVVWITDFRTTNVNDIVADIFQAALDHGIGKYITIIAIVFMIGSSFIGFLATIRYLYGIPDNIKALEFIKTGGDGKVSNNSILIVTISSALALLINNTFSLVEIADVGLVVTLLLVSGASFIDKQKKGEICIFDGLTIGGFTSVLGLVIQKHFL